MKIRQYIKRVATLALMVAILVPLQEAWGQETTVPRYVTGDKYKKDYSSVTITHKAAKWFDLRENISPESQAMDRFDDDTKSQKLQNGTCIQAAHTYLDTIYVHKGDSISLEIPDKLGSSPRVESYQRWYNFRTDGTFRTKNKNSNEVWDLLTPSDANTYCRYANGYVGKPNGSNLYKVKFYVPTDEEFGAWIDPSVQPDNKYYLVACDVSAYTDYTKEFDPASSSSSSFSPSGDDNTYEPTLTHRVIFYIVTVDGRKEDNSPTWKNGMGRLVTEKSSYTGGPVEGKKFLEEYNISFPFTRVSNHTLELVALSKDARSYAIPDVPIAGDQDTRLDVWIEKNNSAGITLATESLRGMERVIRFNYPENNSTDGTQYVNANNSTATIYVTKTVNDTIYNLVRYNLTFVRDTRLLTQTQLSQIEAGTIKDNNLRYYQFRTDKYLEENYELLTSLDFDYDPQVAEMYGQPEYYQFPLPWTANSYSFFDGSEGADFKNTNKYPEWGYYAIMNGFVENMYWNSKSMANKLPNSTYHLYVDASDRPGVIARLPFRNELCTGSELFVTAWVKSAGYSNVKDDAGMLFSIMGVRKDDVLGMVYEPIYRHASSQIRRTDFLSGGMPGTGGSTNEWWQVYFSFKVNENTNYESYALQIDNNSASTDGGDMYIDDIRVYMASPGAEVTQLRPTCADDETLLNIKISWDRLLSRRGAQELTGDNDSYWEGIDFCFVDTLKYHEAKLSGKTETEAIEESVVKVWSTTAANPTKVNYASLYFNLNFGKNTNYYTSASPRLAEANQVEYYYIDPNGDEQNGKGNGFYCYEEGEGDNKQRYLSVDFYSELEPNRTYWMLISPEGIDGIAPTTKDFINIIGQPCGITSEFRVTSQNLLKINGEIVSPELAYCEGQKLDFTVDLLMPGDDGYVPYEGEDVYFDWFFGTETEYLTKYKVNKGLLVKDETNGVSLKDALAGFRSVYSYDEQGSPKKLLDSYKDYDEEGKKVFTEAMYNLIKYYVTPDAPSEGQHSPLDLGKRTLSLTLLETLDLVVTPIEIKKLGHLICWGYLPLTLRSSDNTPQLHPGFNALQYPTDVDFDPNLRIGLRQIREVAGMADTDKDKGLTIVLRGAKYATKETGVVDHLGVRTNMAYLYLVGSDDPKYTGIFTSASQYDYPVGWVTKLHAEEYKEGSSFADTMQIRFDLSKALLESESSNMTSPFNPKEGYWYTFMIPFEEKDKEGNKAGFACPGQFKLTMKVVPEYMIWEDAQSKEAEQTIGNWNNDKNWKRIESVRINATVSDDNKDYFIDEKSNNRVSGFVPMLFTKVIMPKNSKVELYAAGYYGNQWVNEARPSYIADPTPNIQYDLMAFESGDPLRTERYRVSLLDEIHFEPGAEMKHAEYLLYNKAWVDYQLTGRRWYTLASPLKAVVAGDFYTDSSTGTEGSEYFKDIKFNTTDNNRFKPSVYQRGWKGSTTTLQLADNMGTKDVAVAGNWSALYNDVAEAYTPGAGFSLKVQDVTDNATFRLPKADTEYSYYSYPQENQNPVEGISVDIPRYTPGRLRSDTLFTRNTDLSDGKVGKLIEVTLSQNGVSRYYLVGNPFMAHLDMNKFFSRNTGFAKKYWLVTNDNQLAAVGTGDDSWVTVDGKSTAKIAPLQSFFVERTSGGGNVKVTFTQDMQVLGGDGDGLRSANALTITATTTDGRISRAAVAYRGMASDDYQSSEDAELFLDSNLGDVPMVYTVAGTMASSINVRQNCELVPLGVYGARNEQVTLRFDQVGVFSGVKLYDTKTKSYTTLTDGSEVSVSTNDYGRYYLTGGIATDNEAIRSVDDISIYSVRSGEIVATSAGSSLRSVRVYGIGGELVTQQSLANQSVYRLRVPGNAIYVVYAEDMDGIIRNVKLRVR